jgi:ribosomal protein L23
VNTTTVTAKDFNGRAVTDTDEFPTVLAEEQGILPEEIISGFARLRGPSGCVKQAFNATVRGRRIARVTFYVDGEKRKRIVAKSGQRVFRVKVRPGSTVGVHRVTARVVFKASSGTKARTLRLSYRRCVRQVVTPQFAG